MCIIDLEQRTRQLLELAEILNFGRILQNSGVRKTCKTGQNESADKPVHAYINFPSHAHGVYTIAPHLNMLNTPFVMHKQSFGNR